VKLPALPSLAVLKPAAPYVAMLACLLVARCAWIGKGAADVRAAQSEQELSASKVASGKLADSLKFLAGNLGAAVARVDTLRIVRTRIVATADTFRRAADSVILLAPADTAAVCRPVRLAYDLRTSECEANRRALAVDDSALSLARDSLASGRLLALATQRESSALRTQLADVSKARTCHVAWILPCPSRFASAIAGLVGGVILSKRFAP